MPSYECQYLVLSVVWDREALISFPSSSKVNAGFVPKKNRGRPVGEGLTTRPHNPPEGLWTKCYGFLLPDFDVLRFIAQAALRLRLLNPISPRMPVPNSHTAAGTGTTVCEAKPTD